MMKGTIVGLLLFATPAAAHMQYPWECCHNLDCRPTPCDALEEIDGGRVRDMENGQVYDRGMVRASGDSRCHICTEGGLSNGKPICVFILQGS